MKHVEIPDLPDEIYAVIERRALAAGRSPAAEAADMLARNVAADQKEEILLDAIRKDHDAMARKGILVTEEDIQSAIEWGRE
jgi:hypothetical protein